MNLRFPRRVPALAVDGVVAVLVAGAVDIATTVAPEPSLLAPGPLAYALGGLFGALVLGRRRWPMATLAATALVLVLYYSLFPGISPAIPLAVALYSAVVAGWLRSSLVVSAAFVIGGVIARENEDPLWPVIIDMAQIAAFLGVIVLFAHAVRIRRIRMAEAAERVCLLEADRETTAARRVAEERLRIARELHDVLGHTTTLIGVQAQVAADALDDDPGQARSALEAIRQASREGMTELKATIGLLREGDAAPREPTPGLARIDELCETARRAGVRVEASVTGEERDLPVAVDLAGYRIVQEALTNVVRHSGAGSARVGVGYRRDAVELEVVDDGSGQTAPPGGGMTGMTERAESIGGSLRAAGEPGGGFGVHVSLPLTGSAS